MPAKKTTEEIAAGKATAKKPATKKTARNPSAAPKAVKKPSQVSSKARPKVSSKGVQKSPAFVEAAAHADQYIKDPKKLAKLFAEAAEKIKRTPVSSFGETWAYLQAMIRLVRAYYKGTYREVPAGSMIMILIAVIYFVSPIDLIPDFIAAVGYVDDALVVALALNQVKADLDAFMAWELENP